MKKVKTLLLLSFFLFSCGQAQKTDEQIIKETMQTIEIPKQYPQEPFYYVGIYSSNIKWELFINDVQMFAHYQGKITSPIVPLNYNILGSGKQKMTIRMYPPNGQQNLGQYATFRMRLYYRKNFRNKDKPEINILNFELPYEQTKDLPFFEKTFEFEANVPYKLTGWTKSKDLTKVPDLEAKVVKKIEELRTILEKKDTEAYLKAIALRDKEKYICLYATQQEIEEDLKDSSHAINPHLIGFENVKILPVTDYTIVIEPSNRIVKLRQKNNDSFTDGIKFKAIDNENGEEVDGSYLFRFHIPEGSNELEVIR